MSSPNPNQAPAEDLYPEFSAGISLPQSSQEVPGPSQDCRRTPPTDKNPQKQKKSRSDLVPSRLDSFSRDNQSIEQILLKHLAPITAKLDQLITKVDGLQESVAKFENASIQPILTRHEGIKKTSRPPTL